ncbi:MAG: hypothetical protein QNJ49_04385 [Mastigocoleus sp. MO_167.B18]|nr:hypothetical protein [Mastigocoleus sp. MO_167.B18]
MSTTRFANGERPKGVRNSQGYYLEPAGMADPQGDVSQSLRRRQIRSERSAAIVNVVIASSYSCATYGAATYLRLSLTSGS